jgi:hypothetical protein
VRPWLHARTLEQLNGLAEAAGIRTESGRPVRFAPPSASDPYYEIALYETGRVATRPGNLHDWFNALAWLAFPATKARINAMHAAAIPHERGRRGRLRDLLTLFDEGGAIVACSDARLEALLRAHRWKAALWGHRATVRQSLRFLVLGHAVLEKSLDPWPGITCKAVFVPAEGDADHHAARWLRSLGAEATPRELAALPVYGYPGWLPGSERPEFYDDARFFRGPRA